MVKLSTATLRARKKEEEEQKNKDMEEKENKRKEDLKKNPVNKGNISLPQFGKSKLLVPQYYVAPRGDSGKKFKLVIPTSKERNLSSRQKLKSIEIIEKEGLEQNVLINKNMTVPISAFTKKDQKLIKEHHRDMELQRGQTPENKRPVRKRAVKERGRPEKLPKNIEVNKNRRKSKEPEETKEETLQQEEKEEEPEPKRKRGRKPKFNTDEERKKKKREQTLASNRKRYREKKEMKKMGEEDKSSGSGIPKIIQDNKDKLKPSEVKKLIEHAKHHTADHLKAHIINMVDGKMPFMKAHKKAMKLVGKGMPVKGGKDPQMVENARIAREVQKVVAPNFGNDVMKGIKKTSKFVGMPDDYEEQRAKEREKEREKREKKENKKKKKGKGLIEDEEKFPEDLMMGEGRDKNRKKNKNIFNVVSRTINKTEKSIKKGVQEVKDKSKAVIDHIEDGVDEAKRRGENVGKRIVYKDHSVPLDMKNLLDQFGQKRIVKAVIKRTPVSGVLTGALNVFSAGKFGERMYKNFDDLFHLFIEFRLDNGPEMRLEKNARISLSKAGSKDAPNTESQNIGVDNLPPGLTLDLIIDRTRNYMGEKKFYEYSAKDNNCQDFIVAVLKANNMGNEQDIVFVKQNTKQLFKDLPYLRKLSNTVTETGQKVESIIDAVRGVGFDGMNDKGGDAQSGRGFRGPTNLNMNEMNNTLDAYYGARNMNLNQFENEGGFGGLSQTGMEFGNEMITQLETAIRNAEDNNLTPDDIQTLEIYGYMRHNNPYYFQGIPTYQDALRTYNPNIIGQGLYTGMELESRQNLERLYGRGFGNEMMRVPNPNIGLTALPSNQPRIPPLGAQNLNPSTPPTGTTAVNTAPRPSAGEPLNRQTIASQQARAQRAQLLTQQMMEQMNRIQHPIPSQFSAFSPYQQPPSQGSGIDDDDDIDFDDIKWGSFTAMFKRFKKQNPKKKAIKDLKDFAKMILDDKNKFSKKAQKKANFYLNVILSKKK